MTVDDKVKHRVTGRTGTIISEMTGVGVEDDFGDVDYPESSFVTVLWDGAQIPEQVSREDLILIKDDGVQ